MALTKSKKKTQELPNGVKGVWGPINSEFYDKWYGTSIDVEYKGNFNEYSTADVNKMFALALNAAKQAALRSKMPIESVKVECEHDGYIRVVIRHNRED